MHKLIFAAMILALAGCQPRPKDIPTGGAAPSPIGAVEYCQRHPDAELCGIPTGKDCQVLTSLPPQYKCYDAVKP